MMATSSTGTTIQQQQQHQQNQQILSSNSTSKLAQSCSSSSSSSSQRFQHQVSSSTEMKTSQIKSTSSSEIKSTSSSSSLSSSGLNYNSHLGSSLENIVDVYEPSGTDGGEPLITYPESPPPITQAMSLMTPNITMSNNSNNSNNNSNSNSNNGVKSEQLTYGTSVSSNKLMNDSFVASNEKQDKFASRIMQMGDKTCQQDIRSTGLRTKLQMDKMSAEQNLEQIQEQNTSTSRLRKGELSEHKSQNVSSSSAIKLHTETFTAEKKASATQHQRQTISTSGVYNQHVAHSSQSNYTITSSKGHSSSSSSSSSSTQKQMINGSSTIGSIEVVNINNNMNMNMNDVQQFILEDFDDLHKLIIDKPNHQDVQLIIKKYSKYLHRVISQVKKEQNATPQLFDKLCEMMEKAWSVPTYGYQIGNSLCEALRHSGGMDLLISTCVSADAPLTFSTAKLLEQCLTTENRSYVVEKGLENVVKVACVCTKNSTSVQHSRVCTGILEHLFKDSEGTCSEIIRLGGLKAVLFECRKTDVPTLRHCASALANLSLHGGAENHEAMIKQKVPMWLFPLAFNEDDNIKYYACLAIAVLVANKEIEAKVLNSGTLDLVEPFVTTHNPSDFAKSNLSHAHGRSKSWLQRLVPVLSSKICQARNLAAFHFCMEAGIKKIQGKTDIFREIGAIEPLKLVASCPHALASKYAAQALRLIGEQVPHKLSQQVPLWSVDDVMEWVKQIGFGEYANNFSDSRVDGDLLLQLTEENLSQDIGIKNGIRRRRFTRELQNLKKIADYSSRDVGNLNNFLQCIAPEFSIYTYSMLNAGVDKQSIGNLSQEQLFHECGITNGIHRIRILECIKAVDTHLDSSLQEDANKKLDVFISYRRSNGSQLASLLKVHLQVRGFSVFIDVQGLEAGKFDNNLLESIRQAKNFLLVLTPNALERCIEDHSCKDWVHREIVAALKSQCNIIPITDNFQWPEPEHLPEDMRAICNFNGIRWIHDYQDACIDKLERFIKGELTVHHGRYVGKATAGDLTPSTPATTMRLPMMRPSNDSEKACNDVDTNPTMRCEYATIDQDKCKRNVMNRYVEKLKGLINNKQLK